MKAFMIFVCFLMVQMVLTDDQCTGVHAIHITDDALLNITSLNLPRQNQNPVDCTWHIISQNRLQIQFMQFNLDENQENLYISEERNSSESGFQFTGSGAPRVMFPSGDNVWVRYVDAGEVSASEFGFWIQISVHGMDSSSCREEEITCGTAFLACFDSAIKYCDSATTRQAVSDGIELRYSGHIGGGLYESNSGHLVMNVVLGQETTLMCIITDTPLSTEIIWTVGEQIFQRNPGSLVLNSEVLVGQSLVVNVDGLTEITGTIRFTSTLNHQGSNVTCQGVNGDRSNSGSASDSVSVSASLNLLSKPKRAILSAKDPITNDTVYFINGNFIGTLNVLQKQPVTISCKSDDAEPAAFHDVFINGNRVNVTTTVVPDREFFDTISSWVMGEPLYEELQGAVIECSARNDIRPNGIRVKAKVNVLVPISSSHMDLKIQPKPIIVKNSTWLEEGTHYNVSCTVRNTNPLPHVIRWNITGESTTSTMTTDKELRTAMSHMSIIPEQNQMMNTLTCYADNGLSNVAELRTFSVFSSSEGQLTLKDVTRNQNIQNGSNLYTTENLRQDISCTAIGWFPSPRIVWYIGDTGDNTWSIESSRLNYFGGNMSSNVTWSLGGNDTISGRLATWTMEMENMTTSYLILAPDMSFNTWSITCRVIPFIPYQESANTTVILHVYIPDIITNGIPTLSSTDNNNLTTPQSTIISINATSVPLSNLPRFLSDPLFLGGLAGLVAILLCILLILIVFTKRRIRHRNSKQKDFDSEPQSYDNRGYRAIDLSVPFDELDILQELNTGAFSSIVLARTKYIDDKDSFTDIVVKRVKDNATESEKSQFHREIIFTRDMKSHPNIVDIIGCYLEKEPIFLAMPHMTHGNLRDFLRLHSNKPTEILSNHTQNLSGAIMLTENRLVQFARDVACGMGFLVKEQVIHRDLAARNVLIDGNLKCKVADFGLACHVKDLDVINQQQNETPLPVRWMSLESLLHGIFSHMSDVWSYGVVLWEITSLGEKPYPGVSTKDVAPFLQSGHRMPPPSTCDLNLSKLMASCWEEKPEERPTFDSMTEKFDNMLDVEHDYLLLKFVNSSS